MAFAVLWWGLSMYVWAGLTHRSRRCGCPHGLFNDPRTFHTKQHSQLPLVHCQLGKRDVGSSAGILSFWPGYGPLKHIMTLDSRRRTRSIGSQRAFRSPCFFISGLQAGIGISTCSSIHRPWANGPERIGLRRHKVGGIGVTLADDRRYPRKLYHGRDCLCPLPRHPFGTVHHQ